MNLENYFKRLQKLAEQQKQSLKEPPNNSKTGNYGSIKF